MNGRAVVEKLQKVAALCAGMMNTIANSPDPEQLMDLAYAIGEAADELIDEVEVIDV